MNRILVIFIVLCGIEFFEFLLIPAEIVNILFNLGGLVCLILFIDFNLRKRIIKREFGFHNIYLTWFLCIIFSSIYAQIYWNQSLYISITAQLSFCYLFFFYTLIRQKISIDFIIRLILFLGFICSVFYLLNILSPTQLFGFKDARLTYGLSKSRFSGRIFMYLSYFIIFSRIIQKYSLKKLLLLFWYLFVFLLMVRRVMFFSIFSSSIIVYFVFKKIKISSILLISAIIISSYFVVVNYFENLLFSIFKTSQEQIELGENYIRFLSAEYYLTEFSPNKLGLIFGNGYPSARSAYGLFVRQIEENYGYYLADIGFIGFLVKYGVLGVLFYSSIFIRFLGSKSSLKNDYFFFLGITLFYIQMAFFNVEIFTSEALLSFSIVMYLQFYLKNQSLHGLQ